MSNEIQKWQPPTIAELTDNLAVAARNDILNIALNQDPPQAWILDHPMINVLIGEVNGQKIFEPLKYMPIDKQRLLGRRFFGGVEEVILREGVMFQSVYVTVRLEYKHPITGEPLHMDGIGAVGIQTDKGASAADLSKIKSDAVMKALPAAKSYAIKNAYDSIGRIFGGEIQKKAIQFTENMTMYAKSFFDKPNIEDLRELYELKKEVLTAEEIRDCERVLSNSEETSYSKLYKFLQSK